MPALAHQAQAEIALLYRSRLAHPRVVEPHEIRALGREIAEERLVAAKGRHQLVRELEERLLHGTASGAPAPARSARVSAGRAPPCAGCSAAGSPSARSGCAAPPRPAFWARATPRTRNA